MSLVDNLILFFKQPVEVTKGKAPEGVCPNCWGSQGYDGIIRDMYEDKQIAVNNHVANHNFIKEIVVAYIDGITLVKGDSDLECPTCRVKIPDKF
jgi:hypothetical protein